VPNRKLDRIIEGAIVEAYGDAEQRIGFYTMLEDDLGMPFETEIAFTVDWIDMTDDEQMVAVGARGNHASVSLSLSCRSPNHLSRARSGSPHIDDGRKDGANEARADWDGLRQDPAFVSKEIGVHWQIGMNHVLA